MVAEGGRQAAGMDAGRRRSKNFVKAVEKGVLKVMSKMGIATLDAYCGAQVFEALGVSEELLGSAFAGTDNLRRRRASRTRTSAATCCSGTATHSRSRAAKPEPKLDSYGFYKSAARRRAARVQPGSGDARCTAVVGLGKATADRTASSGGEGAARAYRDASWSRSAIRWSYATCSASTCTAGQPIPLDEVEPVEAILRAFFVGGHVARRARARRRTR